MHSSLMHDQPGRRFAIFATAKHNDVVRLQCDGQNLIPDRCHIALSKAAPTYAELPFMPLARLPRGLVLDHHPAPQLPIAPTYDPNPSPARLAARRVFPCAPDKPPCPQLPPKLLPPPRLHLTPTT